MTDCDLCGLPTPDPPVGSEDGEGAYCCGGCRHVDAALDEAPDDDFDPNGGDGDGWDPPEGAVVSYIDVDGMRCTTCEAFVERRLGRRDDVAAVAASYPGGLVRVAHEQDVDAEDVAATVDGAGYAARPADGGADDGPGRGGRGDLFRLVVGGHAAMLVMAWYAVFLYPAYLDAGPAPAWTAIDGGPAGTASFLNLWALTTVVLVVVGWPILRSAWISLRTGQPNTDLLVALAAVNAYVFSTAVMLVGGSEVYFDVAVVIVMAVTGGGFYERRMRRRATDRLGEIAAAATSDARVRRDGGTATVPVDEVEPGDVVEVRRGDRVPVDGTVVEGSAAVDESLVTGASVPVRREPGDDAVAGGAVVDGDVAVRVGDGERTVDRLLDALWRARSDRGGAQRVADRVAGVFVPLVLALAAAAVAWRLLGGASPAPAVLTGLAVLVVSCPCALGIATPLAVAGGVRAAAARGIVVLNPEAFERIRDVDVVALDKTGTLTEGAMRVTEPASDAAMRRAAAVERSSGHPVGEAIVAAAPEDVPTAEDVEIRPGRGVVGTVGDERVAVGAPALFRDLDWTVPEALAESSDGDVVSLVGWDGSAREPMVVEDRPRAGWTDAVERLAAGDRRVVVVTGDDAVPAALREHPDVDEVFAGVPPEAKAATVRRLGDGGVLMVGDGSNDAPALAAAEVGVAVGDGSALAADAADVAVLDGGLDGVADAVELAGGARRRVRENLGWAFGYNAVALPVAALGYLTPLVAAVAMASSSLLVVANSARGYLD